MDQEVIRLITELLKTIGFCPHCVGCKKLALEGLLFIEGMLGGSRGEVD